MSALRSIERVALSGYLYQAPCRALSVVKQGISKNGKTRNEENYEDEPNNYNITLEGWAVLCVSHEYNDCIIHTSCGILSIPACHRIM